MFYVQHADFDSVWKPKVQTALARYKADVMDIAAGFDILRYVDKGLIKAEESPYMDTVFLLWYPKNVAYLYLRLAQQGKLVYNPVGMR